MNVTYWYNPVSLRTSNVRVQTMNVAYNMRQKWASPLKQRGEAVRSYCETYPCPCRTHHERGFDTSEYMLFCVCHATTPAWSINGTPCSWYQWLIDSGLKELGLHVQAWDHFHDVCCCEEPMLCLLSEGLVDQLSYVFIAWHSFSGLTMLMNWQLLDANEVDHSLLDCPCTSWLMPFGLCSNFQGFLLSEAQSIIQEQVQ